MSMDRWDDARVKRKGIFLKARQILAPNDPSIQQAAQRVTERQLPVAPGGVALAFVAAMQDVPNPSWPCKARFKGRLPRSEKSENNAAPQPQIGLSHAIRIKSAEFWLKLGESEQALLEIRALPERLQKHSSVLKIHLAIVRAARESSDYNCEI